MLLRAEINIEFENNTTVFSKTTVCKFPAFLHAALGISCVEKSADRWWFSPKAVPVRKVLQPNQTCEAGRYLWNGINDTKLCCLGELAIDCQ